MRVGDHEVNDGLLVRYILMVQQMLLPSLAVHVPWMDEERERIHNSILESVNETTGSRFDTALNEYLHNRLKQLFHMEAEEKK